MWNNTSIIILAGGQGTRIREIDNTVPKPLIKIGNRAIIFRQIDQLLKTQANDIWAIGGYLGSKLKEAIHQEYGNKVHVIIEEKPLGSGGCLSLLKKISSQNLLIIRSWLETISST